MKKTFQLHIEGKNRDRLLDATKHELRKYLRRERRRNLPEGADFWDFDCKFGPTEETAAATGVGEIIALLDAHAKEGGSQFYVEILAKPGRRVVRPPVAQAQPDTA